MIQNETLTAQNAARAAELRRLYAAAWFNVHGQLTAIGQLVADLFPSPGDEAAAVTRYDVDAMTALAAQLAALAWGFERRQ